MYHVFESKRFKPVRVYTESAVVEGLLSLSLGRTLDELNAARPFLMLDSPTVQSGCLTLGESQVAINKSEVLFAVELEDLGVEPSTVSMAPDTRGFLRAALSFRIHDCSVNGYVHTFEGSDPLVRLQQPDVRFIAVTGATVTGPGIDLEVPFIGINCFHVLAAQESFRVTAVMEEDATTEGSVHT